MIFGQRRKSVDSESYKKYHKATTTLNTHLTSPPEALHNSILHIYKHINVGKQEILN